MYKVIPIIATIHSAVGYAHHTPVIPNKDDNQNAIGINTINPREREIVCAYNVFSVEMK